MSAKSFNVSSTQCPGVVTDPQCIRCLRMKLRATCVAVFLKNDQNVWQTAGFESDKPAEAAEVEFYSILKAGLPEQFWAETDGILINEAHSLRARVGSLKEIFKGCALIAAPVHPQGRSGVRLAWREDTDPFSMEELEILRCFQDCPAEKA